MKGITAFCTGLCFMMAALHGNAGTPPGSAVAVQAENLLTTSLEGVANTDIIVSRVTLPPNAELPKHWHPGEEFAYILEGTVALWLEGEAGPFEPGGSLVKIPLRKVHTAIAGPGGATILVFRVHEHGQPERVPVD